MRVLIQRVSQANILVKKKIISKIGNGLLVFVAFCDEDNLSDITWSIKKIINLRIFADNSKKMNYSLVDQKDEILIVSQFTLFASVKKGNRPSWNGAASSKKGKELYDCFIENLNKSYTPNKVFTGEFGADMKVKLNNNGPVTIFFDSKIK
tara:strand:- start:21 stop:473 length:453 start_codon:yes stop_codon:yes gene_type:complete